MAPDRGPLREPHEEDAAKARAGRQPQLAVAEHAVVQVDDRRRRRPTVAPRRLCLLEVEDVEGRRELGDAAAERPVGEHTPGPSQLGERRALAVRRHRDQLHRQFTRHVALEVLRGRHRVHVDTVAGEAPQEGDRVLARRSTLGQRRRGEHDENPHDPRRTVPVRGRLRCTIRAGL